MDEQQCIVHREAASIATFDVARHIFFLIFSLSPFSSLQPVVLFETRFEQLKILASRTPSATTSRKIEPPLLAHEKKSNDITRLSVTLYYNSTSLLSSNNTKFLKTLTLSLSPVSQIKGKTKSRRYISPYFTAIYLPHQIFYTYRFTPLPEIERSLAEIEEEKTSATYRSKKKSHPTKSYYPPKETLPPPPLFQSAD